jgi:hypothetical protein
MKNIKDKEIEKEVNTYFSFRLHLSFFLVVMGITWVIWLVNGGGLNFESWPVYASAAWGAALLVHFYLSYRALRHRNLKG